MQAQREVEHSGSKSIDAAAHPTAQMLADVLAEEGKNDAETRILREFGYQVGRWIYLIDAADDIEKDLEQGTYNPLLYRFEYQAESESPEEFRARIDERLRFNLFHYLAIIGESLEELDIQKNSAIIENVIYFGLNRRTEEVLKRIQPEKRGALRRRRL